MRRIYLDHAATTPVSPEAAEAVAAALAVVGNPSSQHWFGREALALLDEARDTVAHALGAEAAQVCFTGSGTEAANLAVLGRVLACPRKRVVYSAVEHHCVLKAVELASELGAEAVEIPVDGNGIVDPEAVRAALREPASVVCVQHVNNETGVIQQVAEIARICRERETPFFTDAVQSFGVLPISASDADLIAISCHKVYGPKGVGALIVRPGVKLRAVSVGGGQERERRAGTENVPGVAGLAAAARRLAAQPAGEAARHLAKVRDVFEAKLPREVAVTDTAAARHPGISHLTAAGLPAQILLVALDQAGVAASSGAACASGAVEPSHVLRAMGLFAHAASGLRFSFGRDTTVADADAAATVLKEVCSRMSKAV